MPDALLRQNGAPCASASWGAAANAAAITLGMAIRPGIGFVAPACLREPAGPQRASPLIGSGRMLSFRRGKRVPSLLEQGRPGGYIRLTHDVQRTETSNLKRPA